MGVSFGLNENANWTSPDLANTAIDLEGTRAVEEFVQLYSERTTKKPLSILASSVRVQMTRA